MKKQVFILFMLIAGIVFRVIWPEDMEWKDDEKIMYKMAEDAAAFNEMPSIGMMSGGGVVNPGLSVAVFSLASKITGSPVAMVQFVQWMNVAALLLLLWFIYKRIPSEEKTYWYYGLALAAVNPMAVLFSRKIWAQDTLPLFCILLVISMHFREKRAGAFFAGLLALLAGQIHMSGFFLAAGYGIYTIAYDLYHKRKIHWLFYILGGLAGLIPLWPWLQYVSSHEQGSYLIFDHVLQFRFYIYSFLDAHGLHMAYTFGEEITDFYRYPSFNFTGFISVMLVVLAFFSLFKIVLWIKKSLQHFRKVKLASFLFDVSEARFYMTGVFLGLGVIMTFSGTEIYAHYLICTFPFMYIGLALLYKNQETLLKVMISLQLVLTFCFLMYVHQHNGIRKGDYGITYKKQMESVD